MLSRLMAALILICLPFNISPVVFPYEHLSSFEGFKGSFVAGVGNPVFVQNCNNWDVCCNVKTGEVVFKNAQDELLPEDIQFYEALL